jgi:hypothetical protein
MTDGAPAQSGSGQRPDRKLGRRSAGSRKEALTKITCSIIMKSSGAAVTCIQRQDSSFGIDAIIVPDPRLNRQRGGNAYS